MSDYVGHNDELATRFSLSDLLDIEWDMFKPKDGITSIEGKLCFDALRFELSAMLVRIDAIKYG